MGRVVATGAEGDRGAEEVRHPAAPVWAVAMEGKAVRTVVWVMLAAGTLSSAATVAVSAT